MQKNMEKMPHICVSGIFSEVLIKEKTLLGHFLTQDGAFFRSEGLATLPPPLRPPSPTGERLNRRYNTLAQGHI